MSYTFDISAQAESWIGDVEIGGMALDLDRVYGVVSNNYVRSVGDGYKMFCSAINAYDYGPDFADVTAEAWQGMPLKHLVRMAVSL